MHLFRASNQIHLPHRALIRWFPAPHQQQTKVPSANSSESCIRIGCLDHTADDAADLLQL